MSAGKTRKVRTQQDYEELAALLYLARESLMAALMKTSGKFYAKQQDNLNKVIGRLDTVRGRADDQYFADGFSPESPLYVSNDSAEYAVTLEAAIGEVRRRAEKRSL